MLQGEMGNLAEGQEKKSWKKIKLNGDCWEWQGAKDNDGYSSIYLLNKSNLKVHNLIYEIFIEKIPKPLQLDHLCRNRSCVNPLHLEPVTLKENVLRGIGTSASNYRKTHCYKGHEFSGKNNRGDRICNKCIKDSAEKRKGI